MNEQEKEKQMDFLAKFKELVKEYGLDFASHIEQKNVIVTNIVEVDEDGKIKEQDNNEHNKEKSR